MTVYYDTDVTSPAWHRPIKISHEIDSWLDKVLSAYIVSCLKSPIALKASSRGSESDFFFFDTRQFLFIREE
jgi:hypothetical protein